MGSAGDTLLFVAATKQKFPYGYRVHSIRSSPIPIVPGQSPIQNLGVAAYVQEKSLSGQSIPLATSLICTTLNLGPSPSVSSSYCSPLYCFGFLHTHHFARPPRSPMPPFLHSSSSSLHVDACWASFLVNCAVSSRPAMSFLLSVILATFTTLPSTPCPLSC